MAERGQPPESMTCPACGGTTGWVLDSYDDEWDIDGEWWGDPVVPDSSGGYTCSRRCYLLRLSQAEREVSGG